jgi:hypothetical protein
MMDNRVFLPPLVFLNASLKVCNFIPAYLKSSAGNAVSQKIKVEVQCGPSSSKH